MRDFLKTKGIEQPKVKIESILRVDLDGDGEEEVLISAANYFSKDERRADEIASWKLFNGVVAARRRGKSGNAAGRGEFHPKAYVRQGR